MNNFFLRLYVAAQNHKAAAREDGFVTAEHLALAVAGVVVVGVAVTVFTGEGGIVKKISDEITNRLFQ